MFLQTQCIPNVKVQIKSAGHHRNNNMPFWLLDQTTIAMGATLILQECKVIQQQKGSQLKKKKKKQSSAWKEKKNTHKSLHISIMSSLHLSHSTDAHILYKTTARRINLPEQTVWGLKPMSMSFDPKSLKDWWSGPGFSNPPSLILICMKRLLDPVLKADPQQMEKKSV